MKIIGEGYIKVNKKGFVEGVVFYKRTHCEDISNNPEVSMTNIGRVMNKSFIIIAKEKGKK